MSYGISYEEAVEAEVSRTEAKTEIAKHDGASWEEFVAEFGDHDTYTGGDVLGWLGY